MAGLRIYQLNRDQIVASPLEEIFSFFECPENLARITPASLDFRLLTPSPVPMNEGRIIDYTIRAMRMRIRWRSIISVYDAPHCFVDEQLSGPYSFWHHTHRFEDCPSGTRLTDKLLYALPAWLPSPVSKILQAVYVGPALNKIFDYRSRVYQEMFGSPGGVSSPVKTEILTLET